MTAIGMIHMACYCGADLFYVGNAWDGKPPVDVINLFRAKLGHGEFGIFTSASGQYSQCPHCGLLYELPDPDLMDWLPFSDRETFSKTIAEMLENVLAQNGSKPQGRVGQDAV